MNAVDVSLTAIKEMAKKWLEIHKIFKKESGELLNAYYTEIIKTNM